MAIGLEIKKRFECAYFSKYRCDVQRLLEDDGNAGKKKIISLWDGMHFVGYAVMTPEQYKYFQQYMNGNGAFVGFYDGVKVYEYTQGTE